MASDGEEHQAKKLKSSEVEATEERDGQTAENAVTDDAREDAVANDVEPEAGKDANDDSASEGEVEESEASHNAEASSLPNEAIPDGPPLPNEPLPGGPPLPSEPIPAQQQEDDGWDCQFDPNSQAWYFINRFTGQSQWENPRIPEASTTSTAQPPAPGTAPLPPANEKPAAGGYNPAIHGDYDPNAWYAQADPANNPSSTTTHDPFSTGPIDPYAAIATFNRFTGQFQSGDEAGRHTDEAKSRRQMNAFFDVDAAANSHDGRSLRAERSGKKPSKNELKAFKEKRKARKEEKRRAWLRD